jgi:esterase/lipase superfamily enzyme
MSKVSDRWFSERLGMDSALVRWGHYGTPILVFPTAGGDAEEIERFGLVEACGQLVAAGRVKLYSCDSVAGRAMAERWGSPRQRLGLLNQFHQYVRWEVLPAIHADSGGGGLPVLTAGASIGAFNALAVLCRFPDAVTAAVCMSGTYDLQPLYGGEFTDDLYFSSPLHFLPGLEGAQLDRLRQRFVLITSGEGAWEDIGQSWRIADILGSKSIPNRVDSWGPDWEHDWHTWRSMLPHYLDEVA